MKDDATPATKADIKTLSALMDSRFSKVHEDINRMLDILVNVQETLTTGEMSHEQRITRLERHAGLVV